MQLFWKWVIEDGVPLLDIAGCEDCPFFDNNWWDAEGCRADKCPFEEEEDDEEEG